MGGERFELLKTRHHLDMQQSVTPTRTNSCLCRDPRARRRSASQELISADRFYLRMESVKVRAPTGSSDRGARLTQRWGRPQFEHFASKRAEGYRKTRGRKSFFAVAGDFTANNLVSRRMHLSVTGTN